MQALFRACFVVLFVLSLALGALPARAYNSVTIDAGPWGTAVNSTTTNSAAVTTSNASYILVGVTADCTNSCVTNHVTAVTASGLTFAKLVGGTTPSGEVASEFWGAVSSGALAGVNVTVTLSDPSNIALSILSLANVNTSAPVGVTLPAAAMANNLSATFTGTTAGSMLFATAFSLPYSNVVTAGANTTVYANQNNVTQHLRSTTSVTGGTQNISSTGWSSTTAEYAGVEILSSASGVSATAPAIMNYQARVTNAGGTPITAATNMRFAVYDALSSGNCVWSGWGSGTNGCTSPNAGSVSVTPTNGVFSLALGDTSVSSQNPMQDSLFSGPSRYLEVQMYNGSTWETLSPRKRIVSSAYAFNSNLLNGLSTSSAGPLSASVVATDSSGKLTIGGGAAIAGGGISLTTGTTNALTLDTGTTGAINIGTSTNAKIITLGNNTGATALNFNSGTASQTFTSYATSNAAFSLNGNALTTGQLLSLTESGNSTGGAIGISTYTTAGSIISSDYGYGGVTQTGPLTNLRMAISNLVQSDTITGSLMDFSSFSPAAAGQNITGYDLKLAAISTTSNAAVYTGYSVSQAGAITSATAGSIAWRGVSITMPNMTQSAGGSVNSSGISVTTGTITTAGVQNGVMVNAAGVSAGSMNGINISGITAGAGTENAINIGAGWDAGINFAGAGLIQTAAGNITLQPAGTGTIANVQIGAGGTGSTTPDYLVLDSTSAAFGTGDPTGGANGAMYYNIGLNKFRCYENGAWANCIGASGATTLNTVGAATNTATIANANNAIAWNWGTLTTQTGMTFGGGSAMTTGKVFQVGPATFIHGAAETGQAMDVLFTDASTNISGTSITNGIHVGTTISTSGAGIKSVNAFSANAPTLTGCASGACTWNGFSATTQATGAAATITQNGFNVTGVGIAAGNENGINISGITAGAGTENAINIGAGWDTSINLATAALAQTTATTTSLFGISLTAANAGAISQATNVGTINWYGANLNTPTANLNFAGSTILNDGLKISTGAFTQSTTGTGTANGLDISVGALTATAAGGTTNGISIVGGAITGSSAAAGTTNGEAMTTGALTLTTATTQTINGWNLSSAGALTSSSTGIINWAGATLTMPNVSAATGTILAQGLTTKLGTLAGTTATENGFNVDMSAVTLANAANLANGLKITPWSTESAQGVMTAINILGIATPGNATSTALNIAAGWDTGLSMVTSGTGAGVVITTVATTANALTVGPNGTFGPAFNVDTLANATNLVTNPSFEVNTTGWSTKGTGTGLAISRVTTQAMMGGAALLVDDSTGTPVAGDGVKYAYNFAASTTYTLSFYAKLDAASTTFNQTTVAPYNDFAVGYYSGTADTDCLLNTDISHLPLSSTQWNRYSCDFTPGAVNQYFYIRQTDAATGHKFYIDGVQLEAGAVPTVYHDSQVSFGSSVLVAPGLNSCENLQTAADGTLICGNDLVNHIPLIYGEGHSVMRAITQVANGATTPFFRWTSRLASMLHAQEINRGMDGETAISNDNTLQDVIPIRNQYITSGNTFPSAPYVGPNFLGLVQLGINDLQYLIGTAGGATNTTGCNTYSASCNLNDFKEGLRSTIARFQASAVYEENTANTGPGSNTCATSSTCVAYTNGTDTWTATASTANNSGSGYETLTGTTAGTAGSLAICLPNDLNSTGGTVDIGMIASATNGGTYTMALDGVTVNTTNTSSLIDALQSPGSGPATASVVRRLNVPAGNASGTTGCNVATQHKITITITNVTASASFDYYQIEATSPAPTVVLNVAKQPDYTAYGTTPPNDADINTINAAIKDVVSEFGPAVMIADEDSTLNKNPNNFSTDKLHPNDQGHALIANAVYKAILNAPYSVQQASFGAGVAPFADNVSTAMFTVKDANDQPSLTVNTTLVQPGGLANIILNPSFEVDAANWTANTAATTIKRVTTQQYTGNGSLNITMTTGDGTHLNGAYYKINPTDDTQYSLSFYAKLDGSSAAFTTLAAGYFGPSTAYTQCTLNSNTVVSTGWNRYWCTFTTASPIQTGQKGFWIGQTDTAAHNYYIDSILLQQTGTVNSYDEAGGLNFIGNVVGPVQFQNQSNSTTAFQISSATGTMLMNVDTINNITTFGNATNFGGIAIGGAFIDNTSYVGQEFNSDKQNTAITALGLVGDDSNWNWRTTSAGTGETYSTPRGIGGVARNIMGTTTAHGSMISLGTVITSGGAVDTILKTSNLPVMQMKFVPVQSGNAFVAGMDYFIGMADTTTPPTTNDALPANGVVLWTNNTTAATGGSVTFQGIVRSGSATVGTPVSCTGAYTYGNSITARIQVESATTAHFFIDFNAGNGISFTDCGTVTGTFPTAQLAPEFIAVHTETGTRQFDIDYMRIWQDDSPAPDPTELASQAPVTPPVEVINAPSAFDGRVALADLATASENIPYDPACRLDTQVLSASKGIISPLVVTKGLVVDSISSFNDAIALQSDTVFFGRPYFNADTAGFAVIAKGQKTVDVSFDKEYQEQPIVNASVTIESNLDHGMQQDQVNAALDPNLRYVITNKSVKGFTIMLNQPSSADLEFSWAAFAVKNAKVFGVWGNNNSTPNLNSAPPTVTTNAATAPAATPNGTNAASETDANTATPVTTNNQEPASNPEPSADSTGTPAATPPVATAASGDASPSPASTDVAAPTPTATADTSDAAPTTTTTSTSTTDAPSAPTP